jgi:aminoglycoside 6'-N-acetyltransferase
MDIRFHPLRTSDFALLLKWFEAPHVKPWWDPEISWTPELIAQKYTDYTHGFKKVAETNAKIKKPLHAYIIELKHFKDRQAIGYIQYYNAYDFPREGGTLEGLPSALAALDMVIGAQEWIGRGIGPLVIDAFVKQYIDPCFAATFVDPELANKAAIRAYEKAGFRKVKTIKADSPAVWMIREQNL